VEGGAFGFEVSLPGFDLAAFVVFGLALAHGEGNLHLPVFPVEGEGDECVAFDGGVCGEGADFRVMKEEFARRVGGVVVDVTVGVFFDMCIVQPDRAVFDPCERIPDLASTGSERFDLGAAQDDARFEDFEDMIIAPGFGVGDDFVHGRDDSRTAGGQPGFLTRSPNVLNRIRVRRRGGASDLGRGNGLSGLIRAYPRRPSPRCWLESGLARLVLRAQRCSERAGAATVWCRPPRPESPWTARTA
jgi:hypothetical protein